MTEPEARLDPADVSTEAPHAIVDAGVDGQWLPLIDVQRLIPTMWHKVNELCGLVAELVEEVHAVEATLGVNPHGNHATVADRLAAIEARI